MGQSVFTNSADAPLFDTQTIPLSGFEDWLRLGVIKVEQTGDATTATYKAPDDIVYPGDDGMLSLILDVEADAAGMLGTHAFSLKQTAHARLSLNTAISLSDLAVRFRMFEDLLKVLTGSDYELAWPTLTLPDGSCCTWHFQRMKNKQAVEAPSHYDHGLP
jgi:hypothetical protein